MINTHTYRRTQNTRTPKSLVSAFTDGVVSLGFSENLAQSWICLHDCAYVVLRFLIYNKNQYVVCFESTHNGFVSLSSLISLKKSEKRKTRIGGTELDGITIRGSGVIDKQSSRKTNCSFKGIDWDKYIKWKPRFPEVRNELDTQNSEQFDESEHQRKSSSRPGRHFRYNNTKIGEELATRCMSGFMLKDTSPRCGQLWYNDTEASAISEILNGVFVVDVKKNGSDDIFKQLRAITV
nr:serine/threonine-protein kinase tricorner-like isoform X1 [Tanacetum cinerariifolium]